MASKTRLKVDKKIRNELLQLFNKYGAKKNSIKPVLYRLLEKYSEIPSDYIQILADIIGIHPVEIQDIVSFYTFYNTGKSGKYVIRMCETMPCKMQNAAKVAQRLEKKLGIKFGETTPDGKFSLEWTSCIGMCDQAPVFLINHRPYINVKPRDVTEILAKCQKQQLEIELTSSSKLTFADIDYEPSYKTATELGSKGIIKEITESKLRGCGGAGFPTGLKLSLMEQEKSKIKYIVCNADEGEPGTFKDREILTNYTELVVTGMAIAALAIGAAEGIIYLRAEYIYMKKKLVKVINSVSKLTGFKIEINNGAGAYVCGEETALIESIEGKRGVPRNRPPFPIQAGLYGKPTQVNNVETFAWIAAILSKGAGWFNKIGTDQSAGYKLVSVSGDCKKPGVYEFPMGTTISKILKIVGGEDAKAVQVGGASGQMLPSSKFARKIAFEDAPPGGSIIVFGSKRNMLDVAENFMEFFVNESCGHCTPCRKGNIKLLEAIRGMRSGSGCANLDSIKSLCQTMQLASKCALGQSSPNVILAILEHFKNG